MTAAPPLVSLSRVSFAHPLPGGGSRPALRGVTLAIRPGERLVVLGAGGAGKSTLALLLAGVLRPDGGEVARAPAAVPVGLVTQNPEDGFTSPLVREEMGVVLDNLGRDPAEAARRVDAMLAATGLAGHAGADPARLSGGQKQLLAIASVLIGDPPLLILDEPLALLDAPGRAEVEALLAAERAAGCATVLLSSEVGDAASGERVVVLHAGEVAWEGPPAGLPLDAAALAAWGLLPPEEPYRAPASPPIPSPSGAAGGRTPSPSRGEGRGEGGSGTVPAPFIVIRDLHHAYDPGTPRERPVLRGVDLEARPGEILGVLGAIGSGKTTLIQHLNGLLLPQRGSVTVCGRTLERGTRLPRLLHREVGLVFQFPEKQLFAETVLEDVAAGPEFAGVPAGEARERARAALRRVGLDPEEHGARPPHLLGWGEQRLAAIAGVIVLETPAIALDEPGAGLDPAGRRRVMDLLARLARGEGRAVVVVSHHLPDLFRVADRLALLEGGRVPLRGTVAEVAGAAYDLLNRRAEP